jgi:hypothetical protein
MKKLLMEGFAQRFGWREEKNSKRQHRFPLRLRKRCSVHLWPNTNDDAQCSYMAKH